MSCNISWVVEFQRWWVLKSKFLAKNQHTQRNSFSVDELRFVKKYQNRTFKVNFQCQKSTEFFKKISFKNINLGDHFFLDSIIEPLYFRKLCPKILLIRTHHLLNFTTELILMYILILVWPNFCCTLLHILQGLLLG